MEISVIFGGTGFIGSHFAMHLLDNNLTSQVILADIKPIESHRLTPAFRNYIRSGAIVFRESDVRRTIDLDIEGSVSLIANFAAIHREPGPDDADYFETNLLGAEQVCLWAEKIECNELIFTSSISPYGPTETPKDECSLPVPITAYGSSKLAAEKIHIAWQNRAEDKRRLIIVRPGVVFGPGEGGNVSRLIKAIQGRYFFYMGNKDTRKAGVYVKELCNALCWVAKNRKNEGPGIDLFNMTMSPGPSMKEYVNGICSVAGVRRYIPSVPYGILYSLSVVIDGMAKLVRIDQPINPVRINKLVRSNNILPKFLEGNNYSYKYDLVSALEDWRKDRPDEWLIK